jgi:hypothetical protein
VGGGSCRRPRAGSVSSCPLRLSRA